MQPDNLLESYDEDLKCSSINMFRLFVFMQQLNAMAWATFQE